MTGEARHRSREVALQVLFALDLQSRERGGPKASAGTGVRDLDPESVFAEVAANFELPEAAEAFARELVLKTTAMRDELDSSIGAHARNWRVERMAVVDRNVLRLGAYELAHTDTATPVILDEAVELARRFGNDPSPAFVNGVLDALATTLRGEVA